MSVVHSGSSIASRISWELLAAVATLTVAVTWSRDVTHDAHVVAQRVGRARYQLDALADAMGPVRALSATRGGEARIDDLRARLDEHDWTALFGGRAVRLVPSVTGTGWNLVLEPQSSRPLSTP